MTKMSRYILVCLLLLTWSSVVFAAQPALVQISTIDALLGGMYDGVTTIGDLKQHGDLGIGTFDGLDGEMVVVDGQVFRVPADGHVMPVSDNETTPFASVTRFAPTRHLSLEQGTDLAAFTAQMDKIMGSPNLFCAFKVEGLFKHVRTRSVPKQNKPYPPLVEVVKHQPVFEMDNVRGVLVGFYCPPFVKGVNVPGYHLHFLSADQQQGGHVLAFDVEQATVALQPLHRFTLLLPQGGDFSTMDLERDRGAELEKVEK
ncbi:acetolactate decarboxylase [Desulfuromonas acetoxidans]|uniref:Alpha-acetolactate decarboxylase n=1 Tax=Desulfuromonas acetoxidans (strain DSM 684 / 11070) TaxID=281689 RepID=Q1JWS4_DESA6|nr:acetolactate decarboxylase [Desulfuromonas acetoxidans]EAT14720.1 Acetolactate decarboxylase [Desulfuromonas acetoxidans DSM 684]